jgi:hypothetical protein
MMIRYIFSVLLLFVSIQVGAVNKCSSNGKISYQDAPCPDEGVTLDEIQPETENERMRREHDAEVVSHNLGDAQSLHAANAVERERPAKQRRAVRTGERIYVTSGYRSAHRRAGTRGMRNKQHSVKNRLHVMRRF